jgi:hypothetical protein
MKIKQLDVVKVTDKNYEKLINYNNGNSAISGFINIYDNLYLFVGETIWELELDGFEVITNLRYINFETFADPAFHLKEVPKIYDGELCNCKCHEYYKFRRTCCDRVSKDKKDFSDLDKQNVE